MSAHKHPAWTVAEVAILREVYPGGGLRAALARLPHRPYRAIHVMASRLGIRTCVVGEAPICKLRGDMLEEAIRLHQVEHMGFGRIGAQLGFGEMAVSNAVIAALCPRLGFTPAERSADGRLTEAARERLRALLRKGLKGVEIQLRLGVSAACVAEQRRRYRADLKTRGKAPLPPPGGGLAYSGVRVPAAKKREVEAAFIDGFGTQKVAERTGVSKTVCTRVRARLIRRLRRKGETLTGCDLAGVRQVVRESKRAITPEMILALREQLLAGAPCLRAAQIVGIGQSAAYRIRVQIIAELAADGLALPAPTWRFEARPRYKKRVIVAAELPAADPVRSRSFEEQLAAVSRGEVGIVNHSIIRRPDPTMTLGGIGSAML